MASVNGFILNVVTWNTLADGYSSSKSFPYCDRKLLKWNYRKNLIFSTLSSLNCDIYLLQEVDKNNDYIQYFKNNGYSVYFAKRTNHKMDGCLIAWKQDMFDLITPIYILHCNDLCKICDAADDYDKGLFLKDNIAMIAALKHKDYPNSNIIIGNIHTFWDPNLSHVKLWQTAQLIHSIKWLITKYAFKDYKIIIGGDFNSLPDSDVYRFIINGTVDIINDIPSKNNDESELFQSKLLLFGHELKKLYPWLIWSGIDVICYLDTDLTKLFEIATKEQRLIITTSKKLTQRRNCPKYLLLPFGLKREESFEYLIDRLNLDILTENEYDDNIANKIMCFGCKQILIEFEKLEDLDESKLNQHELNKYNRNNEEINIAKRWLQCPECYQLSFYRQDGVLSFKLQDCVNHFKKQIQKMRKSLKRNGNTKKQHIKVLVFDHYLRELAQQLSWVGIDVKYEPFPCKDYMKVFEIAKNENRTIVTGSKKITLRKECPRFVIVDLNQTWDQRRKKLFKALKFEMDLSLDEFHQFVLRNLWCWNCKGNLIMVSKEELKKSQESLLSMNQLSKLKTDYNLIWYKCDQCGQIQFHTGHMTRPLKNWYDHIMQLISNENDNDNDNEEEKCHGNNDIDEKYNDLFMICNENILKEPSMNVTEIKLLLEYHFTPVAIWLRWCGIDATCFYEKNVRAKHKLLFKMAKEENRIIVTTDDKVLQFEDCPECVLIKMGNKYKRSRTMLFKKILMYFKLNLDLNDIKYRENIENNLCCFNCMEKFVELTMKEIDELDTTKMKQNQIEKLRKHKNGDNGEYITVKCIKCNYCKTHHKKRWIDGYQHDLKLAYNEPDQFFKMKKQHKKDDYKKEISKENELVKIPFNDIVFPCMKDNKLQHPFKLQSAYYSFYGHSPETTNKTKKFSGCLDYIFVSNDKQKLKIINVDKIVSPKEYLPDKSFGSDHLPIKIRCQIF